MLRPSYAKPLSDYASKVFLPYIVSQKQHANRVDIVWDEHHPGILNAVTRSSRGKGVRTRVEPSTAISGNWKEFLHTDENKKKLFSFLATIVTASINCSKQLISTHRTEVLCNQSRDVSEANRRIILHLLKKEILRFPYA